MQMLIDQTTLMVLALLVASLLGGAIGFILRGWYDERVRLAARPAIPLDDGPTVRQTAHPKGDIRGWGDAADGDIAVVRESSDGDGPLVLLVDDRLELLALHSAYLHQHGYRVLTAGDGEAALEFAREHHPAVIVLDHSMPRRTGLEVARELKQDPLTSDIPILMMTAHSYGAVGAAAKEAGCETFLPKPVDPSRMLREVSVWAAPMRGR
jgi:CheY-like chemotaxis protein